MTKTHVARIIKGLDVETKDDPMSQFVRVSK